MDKIILSKINELNEQIFMLNKKIKESVIIIGSTTTSIKVIGDNLQIVTVKGNVQISIDDKVITNPLEKEIALESGQHTLTIVASESYLVKVISSKIYIKEII